MNAIANKTSTALPVDVSEQELMQVLRTSLYPGAADESIRMTIAYCRAAGLDPMTKPVHIVPIWDSKAKSMRDVVMPGIGLYRILASRSGTYAGMGEPIFGPEETRTFRDRDGRDVSVTFPAWCAITVRKLVGDRLVEFPAHERWLENYATDSNKSDAPNTMWRKRPYGQIAKCAEAQALRKAFPEVGAMPTAEEMEGQSLGFDGHGYTVERDVTPSRPQAIEAPVIYPADQFAANLPKWREAIHSGRKRADDLIAMVESKGTLTEAQKQQIRDAEVIEGEIE